MVFSIVVKPTYGSPVWNFYITRSNSLSSWEMRERVALPWVPILIVLRTVCVFMCTILVLHRTNYIAIRDYPSSSSLRIYSFYTKEFSRLAVIIWWYVFAREELNLQRPSFWLLSSITSVVARISRLVPSPFSIPLLHPPSPLLRKYTAEKCVCCTRDSIEKQYTLSLLSFY